MNLPEEGGNTGAEAAAQASPPDAATTEAPEDNATPSPGAEDQAGVNGREPAIPRDRFDQVNTRMQEAEAKVRQITSIAQQAVMQNQQLQQQLARRAQEEAADDDLTSMKKPWVQGAQDPDAAEEVFDAVREVSAYEAKKALESTKNEIVGAVQNIIQQNNAVTQAESQATTVLGEMQQSGQITPTEAQALKARMDEQIRAAPGWRGHQAMLLDKTYGEMVRAGTVIPKAPSRPANNTNPPPGNNNMNANPLQYSGGRGPNPGNQARQREAEDAELTEIRHRFSRTFGNMSNEDLRKMGVVPPAQAETTEMVRGNDGSMQAVPSSVLRGSWEHKRS